ncbi:hypothetical protein FJY71_09710 [candidate division WOR-3 bacterium]|nr:hypothetical protein [candidate division WOR-3 bacterium]
MLDLDSIPDDSLYPEQWHLEHIGAPHAWAIAHGDSNVRLAVVADGVHYGHPDLAASFRVSPLEDINGNRRFDPQPPPEGDLDGLDNDGNGYIDDVIGYDFLDGDPNPVPADREAVGTHGAGTQNAVTDNHVGVSAPPWNVRSIVVRCGSLGSISLFAAISAIYYLVGEDVWSFGMPFGSYTPYQPLADACLYAWESGAIPCGSAGGDGGETIRYPAGHEGVISVASHGRDNWKSPWSNYGAWIDVTAPGDTILSTAGPAGYAAWDGTSVACNVVVGILGWIKSAWPDISNDSALSLLRRMCDTMPDPLYWQGKLGAGRVRMSTTVTGLAGTRRPGDTPPVAPTIVRSVLFLPPSLLTHHPSLFDISGRAVMSLRPGPNDVSGLSPGVYVVRSAPGAAARVVLAR